MKFIDIFAGIGGFRQGMEAAGHECIGFCEFDKYAVASYTAMHILTEEQRDHIQNIPAPLKKNGEPNLRKRQQEILKEVYRNEWYANDIRTVDAGSMPRADCWCFGFPCQDISIAGKQAGLSGRRSGLFYAVTGLIRELPEENKPSYLFIENVKNLLSVNRGFDFLSVLTELDEIGYDAEWEVLNSKDFGVPQNRERVFIVGHLRGRSTRKVFPIGETNGAHNTNGRVKAIGNCNPSGNGMNGNIYSSQGISPALTTNKGEGIKVARLGNCMGKGNNPRIGRVYDTKGIAPCLDNAEGGGRTPYIPISMTRKKCKAINIANTLTAGTPDKKRGNYSPVTGVMCINITDETGKERQQQNRIYSAEGHMTALSSQLGGRHNVAIPVLTPDRREKRQNGRRFKENGDPMFTLTGQDRHGITDGVRIRKLTPKECFRLQGWRDTYFNRAALVNSDSQLYKQAGNGVTVNVIQAIAERMEEEGGQE